jgi:hypothetical protein
MTSALVSSECSYPRLGLLICGENFPPTHWLGDWMVPRTGLDVVERKQVLPLPGLELRTLELPAYTILKGLQFFLNLCCGTVGTAATTGLLYQPRMIGDGDCGEICGMKNGRGKRSTRRKPPPGHFVHHKSHMTRPFEPGPPRWESSD